VATAWQLLTPRLQSRLAHVHFFLGCDPFFAGLHRDGPRSYTFADGRTIEYGQLAHCSYPYHQTHLPIVDRRTTIVIPSLRLYSDPVGTVVHELGHALHGIVGFEWIAEPVSQYASENAYEAFAEAFEAWVAGSPVAPFVDERTRVLFETVAA
jgi:hypothetical protein